MSMANRTNRALSLDVGDRRIGIAISDDLGITARGLSVYERVGDRKDASAIYEIIAEHGVSKVIIGLPLNLDGTDSVQTAKVREFAERLANRLRSGGMADIELILHDERFTTKIAEDVLRDAGMSRKKRSVVIDAQAAVVILQHYQESVRGRCIM
jgi:putative Holliday junction resolvase